MLLEEAFGEFEDVADEVEAIGDLQGHRRPGRAGVGVCRPPVASDDLDRGVRRQPCLDGRTVPPVEKVDDAVPFDVDHDGAVGLPLAECEVVDADEPIPRVRR